MQYSYLIVSAVLSASSMPLILGFAHRNKLYDSTGGRKVHSGAIPRLGGIGMFWSFFIVVLFFSSISDVDLRASLVARLPVLAPIVVGTAAMHFLGLLDDLKNLHAKFKLVVQILAAFVVVLAGYRFRSFGFGVDALGAELGWVSFLITWGWIVGVTNAVNLIDGIDGLAGGVSMIAAGAYAVFYYFAGDLTSSFLSMVLAGVVAGFLFVNFPAPRAKMFMGDSGSLFLGFLLAILPLLGESASDGPGASVGLIPAIGVLAVPIIDTLRAIVRRVRAGVGIATADRLHIHHLFLDYGFKTVQILAILYSASILQAGILIVGCTVPSYMAWLMEFIGFILIGIMFRYASSLGSTQRG